MDAMDERSSDITAGQVVGRTRRGDAKRDRIVLTALRLFAERGYDAARAEDIARAAGIAKGSVFQHFGTKEALFLAAYKRAVSSFATYLDAPEDVRRRGFFATLLYWLERTEDMLREDWAPYRVALLGNYGTDLNVRREITRFLKTEDPYGMTAFVRWGRTLGEVREDIDEEMIVSILEWTVDRFQDALLTEELDPGLFRRHGIDEGRKQARIAQFLDILKRAIGAQPKPRAARPRRRR
jgi:AcrR family transcriptional regulator